MKNDAPDQQKRHELGLDNEQQQHACSAGRSCGFECKAYQAK